MNVGDRVKVVHPDSVKAGQEGFVFWQGPDKFKKYALRSGVQFDDGERMFFGSGILERIPSAEEIAEEKSKSEAEEARRQLIASAGINWNEKVLLEAKQHAWSDSFKYSAPFKEGASDKAIEAAVEHQHQRESSWGQLRWNLGASIDKIDREQNRVYYSYSVGLAD